MKQSTKIILAAAGAGLLAGRLARRAPRYSFRNRVVVISGGSRGLGLAMARLLADEGARIVLLARSEAELEEAQADLAARGAVGMEAYVCDATDEIEVIDVFQRIEARYGRVDTLINNAGCILCAPFDNQTDDDFDEAIAIHLMAPTRTIRAALPMMRRQGEGRILNISSIGGKVGIPHMAAYSASKHALVGLSRTLAAELRRDGIRVTVACPGLMRTGSHRAALFAGQEEEEFDWFSGMLDSRLLSVSADRAADRILEACRRGRTEIVFPWRWRLGALGDEMAPGIAAKVNEWINRALPEATARASQPRSGAEVGRGRVPNGLRESEVAYHQT